MATAGAGVARNMAETWEIPSRTRSSRPSWDSERSGGRTRPTGVTPYAEGPPVLRLLYGFVQGSQEPVQAVLLLGGDKTHWAAGGIRPTLPKPNGASRSSPLSTVGGS